MVYFATREYGYKISAISKNLTASADSGCLNYNWSCCCLVCIPPLSSI